MQKAVKQPRSGFWSGIKILLFAFVTLFLVYPLLGMVVRSFRGDGAAVFTLANYKEFFQFPYYYKTLKNSFVVSLTTSLCACVIGIPVAYIVARYDIPCKKAFRAMVVISLLSPPFIGAYSWIMLLGRNGFITNLVRGIGIELPTIYGFRGLVLVFTLKLFPYIFMYVNGALGSFDKSLEEASENLGVHGFRKLMKITFPLILPTITAGVVIVFMTSLADLGTPMLIGEGYKVLPVLVYEEYMSDTGGNAAMASSLSVIIILCALMVLFLQKIVIAGRNYTMSGMRPPEVKKLRPVPKVLLTIMVYFIGILALAPQITTFVTSFKKTNGPLFVKGFSLESYRSVLFKLSSNIGHTFLYSTVAICLMVLIGMFASYIIVRRKSTSSNVLDTILMAPYVIPGSVLGIVLVMAFNKPPLVLTGTAVIMIISYTIRKMPYIIRSSTGILYQIDLSSEEASINLGMSPIRTFFKITAVLMLPGVLSGAIISWVSTINELSSSLILYSGRTGTISVAIYTEIMKDGYGTAAALASILTVATIISLVIFDKITEGKGKIV